MQSDTDICTPRHGHTFRHMYTQTHTGASMHPIPTLTQHLQPSVATDNLTSVATCLRQELKHLLSFFTLTHHPSKYSQFSLTSPDRGRWLLLSLCTDVFISRSPLGATLRVASSLQDQRKWVWLSVSLYELNGIFEEQGDGQQMSEGKLHKWWSCSFLLER